MRKDLFHVKEIFLTLQGEGYNAGKRAVFVRFAGCNFWSGLEKDRAKAQCNFCDTDFVGTDGVNGGRYDLVSLVEKISSVWGDLAYEKLVVFTGGEPLLQLSKSLIDELKQMGFFTALETNGSLPIVGDIDWITVSPKTANLAIKFGSELKFVYPQKDIQPQMFAHYFFKHFYLQPKDDVNFSNNAAEVVEYCINNPQWRLSVQAHKIVGAQ